MSDDLIIRPDNQPEQANNPIQQFDRFCQIVLESKAISTQRVYQQTFTAWKTYAAKHGFSPMELWADRVIAFIEDGDTTVSTRQRQLAAFTGLFEYLTHILKGDV